MFTKWKDDEKFSKRVTAILLEDGRGLATLEEYQHMCVFLRQEFQDPMKLAVHCHAGSENVQDIVAPSLVKDGVINGIWAGMIPQAALGGHNSWIVFLHSMLNSGVKFDDYLTEFQILIAREMYYLNYNTMKIVGDCPVWGDRVVAATHSSFALKEGWKSCMKGWYKTTYASLKPADPEDSDRFQGLQEQIKKKTARIKLLESQRNASEAEFEREKLMTSTFHWNNTQLSQDLCEELAKSLRKDEDEDEDAQIPFESPAFRISALVSDTSVWKGRCEELQVTHEGQKVDWDKVRGICFRLMNVGLRINFDSKENLKKILKVVDRAPAEVMTKEPVKPVANH